MTGLHIYSVKLLLVLVLVLVLVVVVVVVDDDQPGVQIIQAAFQVAQDFQVESSRRKS